MRVNPYRGEVAIRIGERDCVLRFGWTQLKSIKVELGADFDTQIGQALVTTDLDVIARVLVIGLEERWPEVSAEMIEELSPPIDDVSSAITLALKRSFRGLEEVPAQPETNPPGRLKRALKRIGSFWR